MNKFKSININYFQVKEKKGFGMIDLIIASSIIFFLLLGIGELMLNSSLFKWHADSRIKAGELALTQMERIRGNYIRNQSLQTGEYSITLTSGKSRQSFLFFYKIIKTSPDVYSIIIECEPKDLPQKKIKLLYKINKQLGF